MAVSDEIIKVLEYLCEKIGLTIDWTNDNVLPYLETLCEKFVKWEIATSTTWIVISIITILLSLAVAIIMHKIDFTYKHLDVEHIEWIAFAIIALIAIIVICFQVFDIIECSTFPEKAIYDYIKLKIGNATAH